MACNHVLIGAIAGALLAGCGGANNQVICNRVTSFASPAVSCVAAAEPRPAPPVPVAKPEPKPEPRPEPEPPKPVVVKKESIELDRTVQFEPDSAKLIEDSRDLLDEVAKALEAHPEIKQVSIEGHTDSRLSARHNQKLSVQRASSVRSYLVTKGIAKDRLVAKGFGATQPVADNSTWKGRFQNRRVHLRITQRDDAAGGEAPKAETKPKAEAKQQARDDSAGKTHDAESDENGARPGGAAQKHARNVRKAKDADGE
jgi:OOP family OmpA-OmpF porin